MLLPPRPRPAPVVATHLPDGTAASGRPGAPEHAGAGPALEGPAAWRLLRAALQQTEWVVSAKPPLAGPHQMLQYVARYTHVAVPSG